MTGVQTCALPILGNWKGLLPGYENGWTGVHEWEKEMDKADAKFGPIYAKYASMTVEQVAQDPAALKMGGRLFASNCSVCHGSDAKGAFGFPNLADSTWRWAAMPTRSRPPSWAGASRPCRPGAKYWVRTG